MIILGIDTSCDDTSVAVVENGTHIRSNVVSSQVPFHRKYGGVVPEIAARKHTELIPYVIKEAMDTAAVSWTDLDAVAVTECPGLIGSLIVGAAAGKSIAWVHEKPLIPVNHIQAHLYAPQITPDWHIDRFIGLIVSGGHTILVEVDNRINMNVRGRTIDDAAGEAFDKVAKLMNLGYPGGPAIQKLLESVDSDPVELPRPMMHEGYNFSFSGLKTATRVTYEKWLRHEVDCAVIDIAAGFQEAVVDVLRHKTFKLVQETRLRHLVVTGGVAANNRLRDVFEAEGKKTGIPVIFPSRELCTDNAAMVAGLAYHLVEQGVSADLDLNPQANILPRGTGMKKHHGNH